LEQEYERREYYLAQWKGPLPPPEIIEAFDRLVPNGAERVFHQFEREAEARRTGNARALLFSFLDSLAARATVLLLAAGALWVAYYALTLGHELAASTIAGVPLALAIGYVMKVRSESRHEEDGDTPP